MLEALSPPLLAVLLFGSFAVWQLSRSVRRRRERYIGSFVFPSGVLLKLRETFPCIGAEGADLTARALRQFFLIHLRTRGRRIVMPSKAADALWHAFILDTKAYTKFCRAAFGGYFHHVPGLPTLAQVKGCSALQRTWRYACLEENIDPHRATRVPMLYALDVTLGIEGAVLHFPSRFRGTVKSDDGGGSSGGCSGSDDSGGCGSGCGGD